MFLELTEILCLKHFVNLKALKEPLIDRLKNTTSFKDYLIFTSLDI